MFNRNFFIGFAAGFILLALIAGGLLLYVTSRMLPKIEKIQARLEVPSDITSRIDTTINLINISNNEKVLFSPSDSLKPVVVNHWATWCKPCIAEMDSFHQLYDKVGEGTRFYFISDEPLEKQKAFIATRNWNLPFYQNTDSLPSQLARGPLPTTYILKEGVIYYKQVGKAEWNSDEVIDFILTLR